MTRRHYSNTSSSASAAVLVGAADTSIALADFTGFPSEPFVAALDKDTADEEIVLVTGVVGSTVTVTRGYDGTLAKAHAAGASFRHIASAIDFDEANEHVSASSGVHGLSGSVVGTSDEQTLSNKTLTAPTISNPTFTGSADGVDASFSGTVSGATGSFTTLTVAGNASVTGALDVDGATTLAGLTAGASQLASAAVTGNVTVGGTLGVSGALSGASAGFSGTVTAAGLTVTTATADELELEQQATDATAGTGNSSLYAKTGGGLWFRPNGQAARRAPMTWTAGGTLPTTGAIQGDTFYNTALGSLMRYNGSNWRQIDGPTHIANMAARPASDAVGLHAGFQVWDISTSRLYIWDGTNWRTPDAMGFIGVIGAGPGDYITAISQTETGTTNASGERGFGYDHTFSAAPVFVQATNGSSGSTGTVRGVYVEAGANDTTGIQTRWFKSDGSVAGNATVRINYTVIGYNT